VARFAERFGDTVAVLHAQLGAGERFDEWMRLRRGEARICVGPRSAVFAPLHELGLVRGQPPAHQGHVRSTQPLAADRRHRRLRMARASAPQRVR